MCGRFTLGATELEILEQFQLDNQIPNYLPRYNIAPGQEILAIIHDGVSRRAGYLKWGLVPSWAKDSKIGHKMINARSETAHEKPSFKKLLARKRCLIVADSFYEWKRLEDRKQPIRISLDNRKLFSFAGLWDKWEKENEIVFTCTILTRAANDYMQPIHDRMPVILPKDKEQAWIEPTAHSPYDMYQFITNLQTDDFISYPVSDLVNAVKNENENCIRPITSN